MGLSGSQKAIMYALGGVARGGATRGGYTSPRVCASLGGVQIAAGKSVPSYALQDLTITDIVDETPNTASFSVLGYTPTVGMNVVLTLGSRNNASRLFAGLVTVVEQDATTPALPKYRCSAIDYTYLLNQRKVIKRYTNLSATAIVLDLIATYGAGFTTANVAIGLDTIDEITFTNQDLSSALTNLAKRIGAYWYVDYQKDIHFFSTSDLSITQPVALTAAHVSLSDVAVTSDMSQWMTRVFIEGEGASAAADIAVGETQIPVDSIAVFRSAGGVVVSGPQRITYTGRTEVAPSAAPVAIAATGAGVAPGTYHHAETYTTAAGESLPSPVSTLALSVLDPPPNSMSKASRVTGSLQTASWYGYVVTFVTAAGETNYNPVVSAGFTGYTGDRGMFLSGIPVSLDAGVTARKIYRSAGDPLGLLTSPAFAGPYGLVTTIADNVSDVYFDTLADASLGAAPPTINTATAGRITLSLTIGPPGTTGRKAYRTTNNGSQPKLLATVANNVDLALTDSTPDGSLGANAPTADTSGLTVNGFSTTSGATAAGSTTLLLVSATAFVSTGGWARIQGMTIRYTGKTGTQLTGIPATGSGSITASVPDASLVQGVVALIGIPESGAGSIIYPINTGDGVQLLAQVDDAVAQAALAALVGGDGIREDYIQDRRISYAEAIARGQATLDLRNTAEQSLRWKSRDQNTRAGATVTVTLPAPTNVAAVFKIQQVTISLFGESIPPTYDAHASTTRFSFEDLLRAERKG